ncbi:hypothetical protein PM082_014476 [Marasmius tenuissimus]|nr:hypothetical protein PM082_014476 [Marasmius tenuissimus]
MTRAKKNEPQDTQAGMKSIILSYHRQYHSRVEETGRNTAVNEREVLHLATQLDYRNVWLQQAQPTRDHVAVAWGCDEAVDCGLLAKIGKEATGSGSKLEVKQKNRSMPLRENGRLDSLHTPTMPGIQHRAIPRNATPNTLELRLRPL